MSAFYELRQYKIKPGKMSEWLKLMENEIIPFQASKGAVITASFRGETDESVYVWIRRFESEADRERIYKDIYESEFWTTSVGPRVGELIDRSAANIQRVVPTRMSPAQ
ncbi:MAG: NIPSNAP family protein [Hyphomicrobiaceae bacterium]